VTLLSRQFKDKMRARLENSGSSEESLAAGHWKTWREGLNTILELQNDVVKRAFTLARNENLKDKDVILEIGCNSGDLCAELRRAGFNAIGLDLAPAEMNADGRFVRGSIERMPLKSGSVRLLLDSFTLCYTDMERSVDEIRRVLAPGGAAFFMLHHPDKVYEALIQALEANNISNSDFEAILESEVEESAFGSPTLRLLVNVFESSQAIAEFFERKSFQVQFNGTDWLRQGRMQRGLAYCVVVRKG